MRAFYIVGIYLQLRLSIHTGITSSTEVTVCLLRTGMLRIRTYQYQTGKSSHRLIVKNIFKQLIAGTIRHGMIYRGIIVHVLVFISNGHTTKIDLGTFTGKGNFCRITGCPVMKCHSIKQYIAGVLFCKHFNNLSCQEVYIIHCMIANKQTGLSPFFKDNQHTAVYHEINIRTKYIDQLNRSIDDHILRNIHQYSILCKSCIKSRNRIFRSISQLTIILLHKFRMLFSHISQTTEDNSFRQSGLRKRLIVECIVHYKKQ